MENLYILPITILYLFLFFHSGSGNICSLYLNTCEHGQRQGVAECKNYHTHQVSLRNLKDLKPQEILTPMSTKINFEK